VSKVLDNPDQSGRPTNPHANEPRHEPYPETCGCMRPKYLDVFAKCWRHVSDDSACVPTAPPRSKRIYADTSPRTVSWPLTRSQFEA
jgi:hypothetical protein